MARTRATSRWRPENNNFNLRGVAAAKEIANACEQRRNRGSRFKIKSMPPQGKDVEVKQRGDVVRQMRV